MTQSNLLDRLIGISLLSAAGLLLELSLTRLVSAIYFPPYVFGVLALAVLGIGFGAALTSWIPAFRESKYLPFYVASGGVSIVVLLLLILFTGVAQYLFPSVVLLTLPYFFMGLALSNIFSNSSGSSQNLYMADLIGAGSGAILAIPIMNLFGPLNSILLAASIFGIAAYTLSAEKLPLIPIAAIILSGVILLTNISQNWLQLDISRISSEKPLADTMAQFGAELLETRWDAFARTDLVQPAGVELPRIYMDGAAGSVMPPVVDRSNTLFNDIGFFPFATDQPERVLVIGPGAGLDVWFARQTNAREIVGIEVNPASVELVQAFDRFNGNLYRQPNVTITIDEARSALQRDDSQYDLIYLSQVVTLTAERTGFALTENTIYTVEAFSQYWSHLNENGVLAIKLYDDITAERALATILASLEQAGIPNQVALQHIMILADPAHNPPIPLIMVRKSPYSENDSRVYGRILRDLNFAPLFLPYLWVQPPLDTIWEGVETFSSIVTTSSADISPTTDDSPFFYQFERGIPQDLQALWTILVVVIIITMAFVVLMQRHMSLGKYQFATLYFAGLGLGFMMIEVAIIQQTRLFLGHPTIAVTTVLATLLIGGGLGSGIAGRWFLRIPILAIFGLLLVLVSLWAILWNPLSGSLLGSPLLVRISVVIITLLPIALVMGMPFSWGLRVVGEIDQKLVGLAWVVNGVMTVVGSAASVTIAMLSGFTAVLFAGLLAYIVCTITAYFMLR
jgi:hypothetical protein